MERRDATGEELPSHAVEAGRFEDRPELLGPGNFWTDFGRYV